jgi:Flp pilus assembly protein TadD
MAATLKASAPESNPLTLAAGGSARVSSWATAAAIAIITIVAYLPILHAGYIWDDNKHITANLLLRNVAGLHKMWRDRLALPQYYPLTHTFFWIEYHLWGARPLGYHAVNLRLHAANAIFVWMILRQLGVRGALLAAILFAVHPVNVETVGWISERKNTLSGFFYLLCFLAYLQFDRQSSNNRPLWYALSLLLFVSSLLCKSVTCTLPAAVLLILWWRNRRLRLGDLIATLPFFVIGALLGLHTAYLERTHLAASGPEWRFASTWPGEVVARFLIAGRDVWFYLTKLLIPYPLMFEYPRWHINIGTPWQYAFPASLLLMLIALLLLRNRIGHGPITCILFFVGTLFPALGFANLYPMRFSFVADHFQYLASIGPLTLIAAGITKRSTRMTGDIVPAEIIVAGLMFLTFVRTFAFQSEGKLYADSLSKNPNGWMSQTNFGAILGSEGDLNEAAKHLMLALQIHPNNAVAADKLGMIAEVHKQDDDAFAWFHRAIQMEPTLGAPHYDLACLLEKRGEIAGAIEQYRLAIQYQPNNAPAHLDYGLILASADCYADAVKQLKEVVRIDPASALARHDLITILERSGQLDQALEQIHELLLMTPRDALLYNNLGLVETARHHADAATAAFRRALTLDPSLIDARQHLTVLIAPDTTKP